MSHIIYTTYCIFFKMRQPYVKKGLAVVIIFLFIGIVFASSITANSKEVGRGFPPLLKFYLYLRFKLRETRSDFWYILAGVRDGKHGFTFIEHEMCFMRSMLIYYRLYTWMQLWDLIARVIGWDEPFFPH